ncbi:MAG TPA: nuclear transport factor 2 family protein [Terriglobales bacterium]|nr:nuclear transport factor 2 family protein [Terriglobales bacterium]
MWKSLLIFSITPILLTPPAVHPVHSVMPMPQAAADGNTGQLESTQKSEIPAEARQNLEEGIKHLLVSQVEAWNRGDLEGFMHGYWNSPDLTFFSGSAVTKGWAPTLARYKQRYQSEGREMGKLEFQDLDIDLLSRRSAVVMGKWQLTMKTGQTPHGLFTLVLKRMPEGWRIVHDHTSGG